MAHPRILSVGQCGYDHGNISRHLARRFRAEVDGADTVDDALARLRSADYDLVLVNRVLDADGSRGTELIRTLKSDPDLAALPVMLVSNYPQAQAVAVALGALPGFGKSELSDPRALERIQAALPTTDLSQ